MPAPPPSPRWVRMLTEQITPSKAAAEDGVLVPLKIGVSVGR